MSTGLSLENLAQVLHADKQRTFAEERFAHQVEMAQNHRSGNAIGTAWREQLKHMNARHLVVRLAVRPLRLILPRI